MSPLPPKWLARSALVQQIAERQQELERVLRALNGPMLPPLQRHSLRGQYVHTKTALAIARDRLERLGG